MNELKREREIDNFESNKKMINLDMLGYLLTDGSDITLRELLTSI